VFLLVFDRLGKEAGAPVILHALVVILLALALVGSLGSILVSLYNSFSNPYQTYMGPIGVYTCSGLSGEKTYTLSQTKNLLVSSVNNAESTLQLTLQHF